MIIKTITITNTVTNMNAIETKLKRMFYSRTSDNYGMKEVIFSKHLMIKT